MAELKWRHFYRNVERERAKKQGNSLRRERSGDVYQVGSQKGSA